MHKQGRDRRKEGNGMSSKLGFGLMRLPRLEDGSIDIEQSSRMVDIFIEGGGTYFDTAFVYDGSEEATKKILVDRYPRESYTLATKANTGAATKDEEGTKKQLYTSLERTGAGYFDYYLLHSLMSGNVDAHKNFGMWDYVARKKEEGLIKHYGFSFHDGPELLDKLLTEHPDVEFVQLQINYADWENEEIRAKENYAVARQHGKQIVIMEPVKGGTLATLPEEAEAVLKQLDPEASIASWALRYAASLDGILAALSGMSTIAQVEDNISFMGEGRFKPLSKKEKEAVEEVRAILAKRRQIGCTACGYCLEGCPMNINIPGCFSAFNQFLRFGNPVTAQNRYRMRTRDKGKASECIFCGACEGVCPQHLPIRDLLAELAPILET